MCQRTIYHIADVDLVADEFQFTIDRGYGVGFASKLELFYCFDDSVLNLHQGVWEMSLDSSSPAAAL